MPVSAQPDYLQRILIAQQLVAARLNNPPALAELAQAVHWSPYHFHRIFQSVTGETVGQLTQRLRLERAAIQLRYGKHLAAEVAAQTGYHEPAAFHRAFRRHFGLTPGHFRQQTLPPTPLPPGSSPVERVHVAERPLRQVLRHGFDANGFAQAAQSGFGTLIPWAATQGLLGPDIWLLALMPDDPSITAPEKARYYASLALPAGKPAPAPTGEVLADTLAAGIYARLTVVGQQHIVAGWQYLYGTWLPQQGEPHPERISFEVYRSGPDQPPERRLTELYLPLAD